ncbi:MAG: universal stress protein [Thermoleophilia bacterium]|nr:universal stress protein [Thermoleophilia bacterium]
MDEPGTIARKSQTPTRFEEVKRVGSPPPFRDVLCAVDGSRGSEEAIRQGIALDGPGTRLSFVAVCEDRGVGLAAQADLGEHRARSALDEASALARKGGGHPSTSMLSGASVSDLLLAEAADHDLLVVGCHGGSWLGGVMLGSTATQIAHRAEGPVLVARRTADGDDFPQRVLLATDGSPGSWAAARTATCIAEARQSELRLVYVPGGMSPARYREVLKQLTVIEKATGYQPRVVDKPGQVAERITGSAQAAQSSLIVIGRRGVKGLRALGSVSERVVHRAPCSVLLVPPGMSRSSRPNG